MKTLKHKRKAKIARIDLSSDLSEVVFLNQDMLTGTDAGNEVTQQNCVSDSDEFGG